MNDQSICTVIIPTFNRPRMLARAIRSVLQQSMPRLDVVVCDNGSDAETLDLVGQLKAADKRIRYFRHATNIGATANFNFGLNQVKTKFFSFLSDDDVLYPSFLETAVAGFKMVPDAGMSATDVLYVESDGSVIGRSNSGLPAGVYKAPNGLTAMMDAGHPPTWTGVLFRHEIVGVIGALDSDVGGAIDYDFEQRAAAKFPLVVSSEVGALFTVHRDSWGQTGKLAFVWPGWRKMISNIADDDGIDGYVRDCVSRSLTRELRRKVYHYGKQALKRNDYVEAKTAVGILVRHLRSFRFSALLAIVSFWWMYVPGGRTIATILKRALTQRRRPTERVNADEIIAL